MSRLSVGTVLTVLFLALAPTTWPYWMHARIASSSG